MLRLGHYCPYQTPLGSNIPVLGHSQRCTVLFGLYISLFHHTVRSLRTDSMSLKPYWWDLACNLEASQQLFFSSSSCLNDSVLSSFFKRLAQSPGVPVAAAGISHSRKQKVVLELVTRRKALPCHHWSVHCPWEKNEQRVYSWAAFVPKPVTVIPCSFTLGWVMQETQDFPAGREKWYERPSCHLLGAVIHNSLFMHRFNKHLLNIWNQAPYYFCMEQTPGQYTLSLWPTLSFPSTKYIDWWMSNTSWGLRAIHWFSSTPGH